MSTKETYGDVGFGGQSASPYQNQALQALIQNMQNQQSFSGAYGQGAGMLQQRALAGSPELKAAEANADQTLAGNYMSGGAGFNASLNAAVDNAKRTTLPMLQSRFASSGQPMSALAQQTATNSLGQTIGDTYAQNYDSERQRQMQAAGMAPTFAQADYGDANQLMQLGEGGANSANGVLNAINQGKVAPTYSNKWMGILGGILGGANEGMSLYKGFSNGGNSSDGGGGSGGQSYGGNSGFDSQYNQDGGSAGLLQLIRSNPQLMALLSGG